MNLGICAWELPMDVEGAFAFAKENEFANISIEFDYAACKEDQAAWCEKICALVKEYDMPVSILALNVLCDIGMSLADKEAEVMDVVSLGIETAVKIGAPAVHLPSFGQGAIVENVHLEQTIEILKKACAIGEQLGVQVGHESQLDEQDNENIVFSIDSPAFYLLFDNENLATEGIDPVETYCRFSRYIRHAHIKFGHFEDELKNLQAETRFGGIDAVFDVFRMGKFDGFLLLESPYNKEKVADGKTWQQVFEEDMAYLHSKI